MKKRKISRLLIFNKLFYLICLGIPIFSFGILIIESIYDIDNIYLSGFYVFLFLVVITTLTSIKECFDDYLKDLDNEKEDAKFFGNLKSYILKPWIMLIKLS